MIVSIGILYTSDQKLDVARATNIDTYVITLITSLIVTIELATIYATTDYINFWGTISHAIRDQVIVVVLCRGVDNFCVTMCASSYLNLPIESVSHPDPTQLSQSLHKLGYNSMVKLKSTIIRLPFTVHTSVT